MKSIIVLIMATASISLAGAFSTEPPPDLLASEVTANFGTNNTTSFGFTVKQLTDSYKEAAKVSWDKDGKNWLYKIERADKATDKKVKISLVFEPYEKGKAFMARWVIDDESLTQQGISAMLMRVRNDFISVGIIKDSGGGDTPANKKTGSSKKPATKAAAKPHEPENLSKGLKGNYVQQYAEDANSSAFSIEETSADSIRLIATAPGTCGTTLSLKKGFAAGQIYAKSADNVDFKFEIFVNDGEVRFESRVGSKCSGPCCDLKKAYLRQ